MMIDKKCKKHGVTKYTITKDKPYGDCRKCQNERRILKRKQVKRFLVDKCGGRCVRCGYNKCIDALCFHHLDPSQKEFEIGYKITYLKLDKILEELKKCIMVCNNCHSEIHYETMC